MAKIGLCMIVKDEEKVIARCIKSVLPLIDMILIVDTGSTDDTEWAIHNVAAEYNLPSAILHEPWRNFAYNRTFALERMREYGDIAGIDYVLMIDADEVLVFDDGFDAELFKASLTAGCYDVLTKSGNTDYYRPQLFSNKYPFYFKAVLHEYLECDPFPTRENAIGFHNVPMPDGARNQNPNKYKDDAKLLEQELKTETDPFLRSRYTFYLAQSYRDSNNVPQAITNYIKRSKMGYWDEEVFVSLHQAAKLSEQQNIDAAFVVERYLNAFQYRPTRCEPLVDLSMFYRQRDEWHLAHLLALKAVMLHPTTDMLFVNRAYYDWVRWDECAVTSYHVGEYHLSQNMCLNLLDNKSLPSEHLPRVLANLNHALRTLGLPEYHPDTSNNPHCPICDTNASHKYNATPYWVCPSCDTWFQHGDLPKVYQAEHEPAPDEMPENEREINRNLGRLLFRNVMVAVAGNTLDIGAKLPVMAAELKALGCNSLAMDGADNAVPLAELMDVPVIGADFEQWDMAGHEKSFRLITLIHCFEHIYHPIAALQKMRKLVTDDGAVFIRLPDHNVRGFERDLTDGHYSIHPFFYSLASMERIIEESGGIFQIEETYQLEPGQRDFILRPTPLAEAKKPIIALNRPGAIGDILMTLNLIPGLREKYPDHDIYYFCHASYMPPEVLGDFIRAAGVDKVMDSADFEQWAKKADVAINLIGYPLHEGYPEKPMDYHLLKYFAIEAGIDYISLPILKLPLPSKPDGAPNEPYATLQMKAGWSKYKEWPIERWEQVIDSLPFPVVIIGDDQGRTLAESISLVANADLHIGIDSFANHLTHYEWLIEDGLSKVVPGVILFGSTQATASGYWHNENITLNLHCQPCFRENPRLSQDSRGACINPPRISYDNDMLPACMDGISVDSVIKIIVNAWENRYNYF
jgi:hypothetical protein